MIMRSTRNRGCALAVFLVLVLLSVVVVRACTVGPKSTTVRIDLPTVVECMRKQGWDAQIVKGGSIAYSRPGEVVTQDDLQPDIGICTSEASNVDLPIEFGNGSTLVERVTTSVGNAP